MRSRATALLVAVAFAGLTVFLIQRSSPSADHQTEARPPGTVDDFLSEYVAASGRVTRPDQGDDTVSEGQAYALMVSAASGDEARFRDVWEWTQAHLQREDGLFAWRWQDGQVVDDSSAADADADIAAALVTGSRRFDDPGLLDEAKRVSGAILEHEVVQVDEGLVLVAGPWAVEQRIVNPSYLARCDYGDLADATGDDRWNELGRASMIVLGDLIAAGLPPDWAVIGKDATSRPVGTPDDPDGEPRYGLDAARIPIRLSACDEGRDLAGRLWPTLRSLDSEGARIGYLLDGTPTGESEHPVGLLAAAGAATASGEPADADRLLREAAELHAAHPTYYGAAWLALTDLLHADGPRLVLAAATRPAQEGPTTTATTLDPTTTTTPLPTTTTVETTTTAPVTTSTTTPTGSTTTSEPSSATTSPSSTSTTTPSALSNDEEGRTSTGSPSGDTNAAATGSSSAVPTGDAPGAVFSRPDLADLLGPEAAAGGGKGQQTGRTTNALVAGASMTACLGGLLLGLRERSITMRANRGSDIGAAPGSG